MTLTSEQKIKCEQTADQLRAGDGTRYIQVREDLYKTFPDDKRDEADAVLNIIFHLLSEPAQDDIVTELVDELTRNATRPV